MLTAMFNRIVNWDSKFKNSYVYKGHLTPPKPQPLSYYITVSEVLDVIKMKHGSCRILLDDDTLVAKYFDPESLEVAMGCLKTDYTKDFIPPTP